MSIVKLGEYRESVLQPLVDNNVIEGIYNYIPTQIETGPFLCVFPVSGAESYVDTCENQERQRIVIKVVNNNIDDRSASENITRDTVDKALAIIRQNDIVVYEGIRILKCERSRQRGRLDQQYKMRICDINIDNFLYSDRK